MFKSWQTTLLNSLTFIISSWTASLTRVLFVISISIKFSCCFILYIYHSQIKAKYPIKQHTFCAVTIISGSTARFVLQDWVVYAPHGRELEGMPWVVLLPCWLGLTNWEGWWHLDCGVVHRVVHSITVCVMMILDTFTHLSLNRMAEMFRGHFQM